MDQAAMTAALERGTITEQLEEFAKELTDTGMGERLKVLAHDQIVYVENIGWMMWDGQRWNRCGAHQELQWAMQLGTHLRTKALGLRDAWFKQADPDDAGYVSGKRLARELESRTREAHMMRTMTNVLRAAQALPGMHCGADDLDAYPFFLNMPTGIYDLERGDMREHKSEYRLTRITRGTYNLNAKAPHFYKFIEEILPDPDVRDFMQRALGSALVGQIDKRLFILYGPLTDNGKSTLLEAALWALGDYGVDVGSELLLQRKGDRTAGDESRVAGLRGKRFVKSVEADQYRRFAEAEVKRLTGEATISAKYMRQDTFEFTNQATIFLAVNHLPQVTTGGDALWNRLIVVPFDVRIPEERIDRRLLDKLKREADGIMGWLLDGWHAYNERGLEQPRLVHEAGAQYRESENYVDLWLNECASPDATPDDFTRSRDAWRSYEQFMRSHGRPRVHQKRFNAELEGRGYPRERRRLGGEQPWLFCGLKLLGTTVTDAPAI